jgi:hypothetical protein
MRITLIGLVAPHQQRVQPRYPSARDTRSKNLGLLVVCLPARARLRKNFGDEGGSFKKRRCELDEIQMLGCYAPIGGQRNTGEVQLKKWLHFIDDP